MDRAVLSGVAQKGFGPIQSAPVDTDSTRVRAMRSIRAPTPERRGQRGTHTQDIYLDTAEAGQVGPNWFDGMRRDASACRQISGSNEGQTINGLPVEIHEQAAYLHFLDRGGGI